MHLGASGLVFGYLTYLVTRGVIAKNLWWILGGLVVLAFYGGLLWGLLPTPRVSWLGHVFGAVGGVLAAWVLHGDHDLRTTRPPRLALVPGELQFLFVGDRNCPQRGSQWSHG